MNSLKLPENLIEIGCEKLSRYWFIIPSKRKGKYRRPVLDFVRVLDVVSLSFVEVKGAEPAINNY